MKNHKALRDLLGTLRKAIQEKKLTEQLIECATKRLAEIGHKEYNLEKFPPLPENTPSFVGSAGDKPDNLAEALLWKLGKWKVYKNFVENFKNKDFQVSPNGGIVFSAFAKHLQDKVNPIYDQHAIRALWTICEFTEIEQNKCKSLLFDKACNWKDTGSGDDGSCYLLFCEHIKSLCDGDKLSKEKLDRLLMPLGQAIKKSTKKSTSDDAQSSKTDYERFIALCNRDDRGGCDPDLESTSISS